jgi:hypothetical protein
MRIRFRRFDEQCAELAEMLPDDIQPLANMHERKVFFRESSAFLVDAGMFF